ncbi:MAG: hypothetical protein NVSMB52_15480 [Chloroflexota bacterium]
MTYVEAYLHEYGPEGFEREMVRLRRQQILTLLTAVRPRQILEVGCGLETLGAHCTDFDRFIIAEPQSIFVEAAKAATKCDRRVQVLQGLLEDLVQAETLEGFDFIVATNLLHEVPDAHRLLCAVRSLCLPNATVLVSVPNVYSFHRLLAVQMGIIESPWADSAMDRRFGHYSHWDRTSLESACEAAGFSVRRTWTGMIKPFTDRQMRKILSSDCFPDRILEGLAGMTQFMPEQGCELFSDIGPTLEVS